ncbi:MAG: M42 family metallopeptidase [Chloroflexi bacterium]|nr:M42 family metallopeptidase [Chloroflexota bacterium]
MDSYALLEKLCNVPGIPGFEDEVRETIIELVTPLVEDVKVDTLGNVIATRHGRSNFKLMLDAHMDEIGFMVQHIDGDGFIRFTPIGGWDPRLLPSHALTIITRERRRIEGVIGTKPPHILKPAEREKVIQIEEMFLDIGVTSRQAVLDLGVRVGDPMVIMYPARRIGNDTIMAKALDDRAGCAVVIRTLEALHVKTIDATIIAAFVIAEERGLIGARAASFSIAPDMAIALEGTVAADSPGIPPQGQPTVQGQGPAITVADGGFVVPRKMVIALEQAAEANGIPYQTKVPPYGGTDASAIHTSRGGVLTGVVSVPCRYIHSPFSTCRLSDFDNTWKLLAAFCSGATEVK